MSRTTAHAIAEFQAWMRRKDVLAMLALQLATDATFRPMSMEQVGELMAICFAAGMLSTAQQLVDAERTTALTEFEGVAK